MKQYTKLIGSLGASAALMVGVFAPYSVYATTGTGDQTQDITIMLTVEGEDAEVTIVTPLDNATIVGPSVDPVEIAYANATSLDYTLTYVNENGSLGPVYELQNLDKQVTTGGLASGTDTFSLNLEIYSGYGQYILEVTANGIVPATDSVSFKSVAYDFVPKGIEEETNNPIVTIKESPGVKYSMMRVYKKADFEAHGEDATPVFPEPIRVDLNGQEVDLTLPFAEHGVARGVYKVVGIPFDEDNVEILAKKVREVEYEPLDAPNVPDTGSFFAEINLSRQDLVSTGLAMLFLCVFFSVLIIAKRSKKSRR